MAEAEKENISLPVHGIDRFIPLTADSYRGVGVYLYDGVNENGAPGVGIAIGEVASPVSAQGAKQREWKPVGSPYMTPIGECVNRDRVSDILGTISSVLDGMESKTVKKVLHALHKPESKVSEDLREHLAKMHTVVGYVMGNLTINEIEERVSPSVAEQVRMSVAEMIVQSVKDGWVGEKDLHNRTVTPLREKLPAKPVEKPKRSAPVPASVGNNTPNRDRTAYVGRGAPAEYRSRARTARENVLPYDTVTLPAAPSILPRTFPLNDDQVYEGNAQPVAEHVQRIPDFARPLPPEDVYTPTQLRELPLENPKNPDVLGEMQDIILLSNTQALSLHLVQMRQGDKGDFETVFKLYSRTFVKKNQRTYWEVDKDESGNPIPVAQFEFRAFSKVNMLKKTRRVLLEYIVNAEELAHLDAEKRQEATVRLTDVHIDQIIDLARSFERDAELSAFRLPKQKIYPLTDMR